MTHRRTRDMHALSVCLCLVTAACGASSPRGPSTGPASARLTPMARYFDASQVHRSGAVTAWDALRYLAPHHRFVDVGPFGAHRTPTTVGSGLAGLPAPRIMLDGLLLSDLSLLRVIPASDVIDIQLLGSVDAAMLYGQGFGGGLAVVRTMRAPVRRGQ